MTERRILIALLLLSLGAGCGGGSSDPTLAAGASSGGGSGGTGTTPGSGGGIGGGIPSGAFSFDVGVGGSGGIIGPLYAFGSIVINGLVMNTDDARFFVEGESGASQSDLSEGQQLVIAGDLNAQIAAEVFYRANVKGPVSAPVVVNDALLGTGELQVLGQQIRLGAQTRYVDTSLTTIAQGDLLEISGAVGDDGVVAATFVRRLSDLAQFKVVGVISSLSPSSGSFSLGGLTVDATGAVLEDFPNDMLADGQLVEVRVAAADFTAPASAVAAEIELLPEPRIAEGAELEIKGIINRFASASDFSVSGIPVTINPDTEFEDGNSSMLGPGIKVQVEGVANAAGVLVADEIELERSSVLRYEGPVTAVDPAAGTLTVEFGLVLRTGSYTELEDELSGVEPFNLSSLSPGDHVEILAFTEGSELAAVKVERDDPQSALKLRGRVTAVDQSVSSVGIAGATILEQEGLTRYFDEDEQQIDRGQFYARLTMGASLQATWDNFSAPGLPADELSLEEDDH